MSLFLDRSSRCYWSWRRVWRDWVQNQPPGGENEKQAGTSSPQHSQARSDRSHGGDQPEHREDESGRHVHRKREATGSGEDTWHGTRGTTDEHDDAEHQERQLVDCEH